jgi:hypothetical protein
MKNGRFTLAREADFKELATGREGYRARTNISKSERRWDLKGSRQNLTGGKLLRGRAPIVYYGSAS